MARGPQTSILDIRDIRQCRVERMTKYWAMAQTTNDKTIYLTEDKVFMIVHAKYNTLATALTNVRPYVVHLAHVNGRTRLSLGPSQHKQVNNNLEDI